MTLNPTLTIVLTALVMGGAITWWQILGLILSMAGVVAVVTHGSLEALMNLRFSMGDLWILVGNFCWAIHSVIGKRFIKNISTIQMTAVTMSIGGATIIGLAMMTEPVYGWTPSMPGLAAITCMAVFGTVLAYLWWNQGIRAIGPARTAVFFDLVPIFTMLIAITLGEKVSAAQWVGAVLVITGVLFSSGALGQDWRLSATAPSSR